MLKSLPLLILLGIVLPFQTLAQAVDWLGTTTQPVAPNPNLSTFGRSIAVDGSGNVYTAMTIGTWSGVPTEAFYQVNGVNQVLLGTDYIAAVLLKQSPDGTVMWMKTWQYTGQSRGIEVETIAVSPSGDLYLGGTFQDAVDFDPNAGVFEVAAPSDLSGFLMKMSSEGELIWVNDFQGTGGSVWLNALSCSGDDVVVAGEFRGSVTIGTQISSYTSVANPDFGKAGFIAKFTGDGDFLWNRQMEGVNQYYGVRVSGVDIDDSDNVYITGGFKGFVRFNGIESDGIAGSFGSIMQNDPQNPRYDIFTAAYSGSGDFFWMRNLSFTQRDVQGNDVAVDGQGNVFSTGYFRGLTQFSGSAHTVGDNNGDPQSIYLCKQASDGEVQWVREFGKGRGYAVAVDASGNPVFTGDFEGEADFDPGLGSHILTSNGLSDAFVCRLDDFGNLVWAQQFGDVSGEYGWTVTTGGHTVYAGGQISVPIQDEPGYYNSMFNVKFFPDEECLAFNAIISDVQELAFEIPGTVEVTAYGGLEPYTYVWNTEPPQYGPVASVTSAGLHYVTVTDELGCIRKIGVILSGPGAELTGEFDLQVNLGAMAFSNICNTNGTLWLNAFNSGSQPVSGTLTLDLGPDLSFVSSDPPATSVSGNVVTWDFENMEAASGHFNPRITLSAPSSTPPGTITCYEFSISLLEGDLNPANNHREFCIPLLCSYDPNDKMVYPQGEGEEGFVMNNQTMTYNIRFQNTGTAPAFNVFIVDTIHPNLDISTLKVLGNSHPMVTEWEPGNKITFRFNDIMLPDSASNEPESHGYVIYEIDQMPDISSGQVMLNTAHIFFDLNEPIVTNTVVNTIPFPVSAASISSEELGLIVYPNPTNDVLEIRSNSSLLSLKVIDALGRMIIDKTVNSDRQTLQTGSWSAGIYLVEAVGMNGRTSIRFVKQ